jgi:hypothetical protein
MSSQNQGVQRRRENLNDVQLIGRTHFLRLRCKEQRSREAQRGVFE